MQVNLHSLFGSMTDVTPFDRTYSKLVSFIAGVAIGSASRKGATRKRVRSRRGKVARKAAFRHFIKHPPADLGWGALFSLV